MVGVLRLSSMLVKHVVIFGKKNVINVYSYHGLRFRRLNDFSIIVGREGFLLACYDICILLCDIWYMYFVSNFSQNSVGVLCRVFLKMKCAGQCSVLRTDYELPGGGPRTS